MPSPAAVGQAGLQGWREKVADRVAPAASNRTPLSEDQVRAVIGAVFFGLSVMYIVQAARAAAAN